MKSYNQLLTSAGTDKALRLEFEGQKHILLSDFRASDLDSALGLLEHLTAA